MPTSDGSSEECPLEAPVLPSTYTNLFQLTLEHSLLSRLQECSATACFVADEPQRCLTASLCGISPTWLSRSSHSSAGSFFSPAGTKKPLGKINSGCLIVNGHPSQPERHRKNAQKGQRSCKEMGTEMNVFPSWCCSVLFQGMTSKTGKSLQGLFDTAGQRGPPQGREPACCVSAATGYPHCVLSTPPHTAPVQGFQVSGHCLL